MSKITKLNNNLKSRNKKSQKKGIKLNLLDCLFLIAGIVASIVTVVTNHEHSVIYLILSIVALNCAIIGTILGIKGRRINFVFALSMH